MTFDRRRDEPQAEHAGFDEVGALRAGVRALRHALETGQADPATVARLILAHRGDRDEMFSLLHQKAGNGYVHRVLDAITQVRASGQERAAQSTGASSEPDNANAMETALSGFSGASREVPYRSEMEAAFGESFADVRSHHGPDAQRSTTALNAHAYAVQNEVAFAEDLPSRGVVAHELTHVVQNRGADATLQAKAVTSSPSDAQEREAARVAETVADGGSVSGTISQGRGAAVSRMDAWDLIGIATGPGTAEIGRDAAKRSGYQQLIDDITASIMQSPAHAKKLLTEVMKDHWYEFLQATATLMAVELGVAALMAMPDPTMGTKIAAIVLQALVITFLVSAVIVEGPDAIRLGAQWWEAVRTAHGDPKKIAVASELFAETVFHLVLAVMAITGAVGSVKAGFSLADRAPVSEGGINYPSDSRATSGGSKAAADQADSTTTTGGGKSSKAGDAGKPAHDPKPPDQGTHPDGDKTKTNASSRDSNASDRDGAARVTDAAKGRGLPEYAVTKSSIDQHISDMPDHFAVNFSTTIDGRVVDLGNGRVQVANGRPSDLPDLTLHNDFVRGGQEYAVQIYDDVAPSTSGVAEGRGTRTPLTRYALDKFEERYQKRFGSRPDGYFGTLIESNRLNFQREFVRLRRTMREEDAAVEAVKRISFGSHRMDFGYTQFEVMLDKFRNVDLGGDLGVQSNVPWSIEVVARKP